MAFRRLTVPTYYNGLPAGYGYINNALSGTPALYDGARSDNGPNNGTYFVGFGEDGRGRAVNRGLKQLAENADVLDDMLRRDFGSPTVLLATAGGGGEASINLAGPLWAGAAGTPNTVEGIRTFIQITDENDNELFDAGVECQVTAITGATPGDGWTGNIILTVSPPIPAAVSYKVFYYARSAVGLIDKDAFSRARKYNVFSGGVAWADGTTNPITTVTGQLAKILRKLSAATGTAKIGGAAIAGAVYDVPAGTLRDQLVDVYASLNAENGSKVAGDAAVTAALTAAYLAGDVTVAANAAAALATETSNRTTGDAYLQAELDMELATNFHFTVGFTFVHAAWEPLKRYWIGIETTTNARSSFTRGYAFGTSLITGTDTLRRIACDGLGNAVITTTFNACTVIHELNGSTGTWTRRTGGLGADNNNTPAGKLNISYDPVNATWVNGGFNGYLGATLAGIATSTDRVTWTTRAFNLGRVMLGFDILANNTGLSLMIGRNSFNDRSGIWTSTDGGVSWTIQAELTHGFTTGSVSELAYSPSADLFMYVAGDAALPSCSVYTSPNGITWTARATSVTKCLIKICPMPSVPNMWLGVLANTDVVVSTDYGATWKYVGFQGGFNAIVAAPNQFMLLNSAALHPGRVRGLALGAAL